MAAKSYREVLERYDRARAFGETRSLEEYSKHLNDIYQTQDYAEGLRDGPWTRFSTRADQMLGDTVGQFTAPLGEAFGAAFGHPEVGRQVGLGLPRALLQTAPLYLLGPEAGIPATAAAMAGTGALFGAQTYADTGSAKAATISGLGAAAMPLVGKFAGTIGANMFKASPVAGYFGGSQLGQAATGVASEYAIDKTLGGNRSLWETATSPEFLLNQIPFTVYDAVHLASNVPKATAPRPQVVKKEVPKYVPPVSAPESVAQNDALLAQIHSLAANPDATGEERSAALKALVQNVQNPVDVTANIQAQRKAELDRVARSVDAPITITGRTDKVGNSYRVLVDDVMAQTETTLQPGQTVFVNNAAPVFDPTTGKMKFETTVKNIAPARHGLSETDFGMVPAAWDVNQPELGVQPELSPMDPNVITSQADALQGRIDAARARLNSADVKGLVEMGVKPETIEAIVKAPEPVVDEAGVTATVEEPPVAQLKETVLKYDIAKQGEEQAKKKVAVPLDDANTIPTVVDPIVSAPKIKASVDNGATPTQAVESARLAEQTPVVDKAITEQNVQKKQARRLSKEEYPQAVAGGQVLLSAHEAQARLEAQSGNPGESSKIIDALNRIFNNQKIVDPKVTERVMVALYKGTQKGFDADRIVASFGKVIQNAGKTPSRTSESYKVDGKRVYGSESELHRYIADNNLDPEEWSPQPTDGKRKGSHYIGKRVFDVGDNAPSLNQQVGDSGAELGDFRSSEDVFDTPTSAKPERSKKDVLSTAKALYEDPEALAEDVRTPQSSPGAEHVADVKEQLGWYVEFMEKGKVAGVDPRDVKEAVDNVDYWIRNYNSEYRNITLDSVVPGSFAVAKAMGVYESPVALAKYIAAQKTTMGPVADIMEAIVNANAIPADLTFRLPGTPGHDATGFWYHDGFPPTLNIPWHPTSPDDLGFMINMSHEIVHSTESRLSERADPGAVAYRADRLRVLDAMRNSKWVPQKVRDVVAKSIKDKVYEKLRSNEMTPAEVRARWDKELGKTYKDFKHYVYAMHDPKEMMAAILTDPRVISVAENTPMGKTGVVENVLNFLSKAFNRLIGGTPKTETALSQILKSYDNYLTGGVMRKVYNGAHFVRDSLLEAGVRPEALASRMQSIDRSYARGTLDASIAGFRREMDNDLLPVSTSRGDLHPAVVEATRAPEPAAMYDATMGLLADQLPVHQELLQRMKEDIRITEELVKNVKVGQIDAALPPNVESNLSLSKVKLNAMQRAMDKQALALARFNNLAKLEPEGWERSIAEGLTVERSIDGPPDDVPDAAEVRKLVGLERLSGGGMNPIAKTFMLTQHLKEIYPSTKPVIRDVFDEQGLAHSRATMLNGAYIYNPDTANVDPQIHKSNNRVAQNPVMSEAVSDLFRWQNKEGKSQGLDLRNSEVRSILTRFNETDRRAILQVLKSQDQRHKVWVQNVLPESLGHINIDNTAILIAARETGMLPEQARKISEDLYRGIAALVDPQQGPIGAQLLRQVQSQMTPETFYASMQHAQKLAESTARWIQRVADNPGYTTEQRYGTDKLVMLSPDGKKFFTSGDRQKLSKIQSDKALEGYTFLDYIKAEDVQKPNFGMREDTLNALDQLDAQNEQLVAELLKDKPDLAAQILPRIQRAGDVRASIAAGTPMPVVKRKFVEGREYINMIDNANQFYTRMNNWIRNKGTRARTNLDMMHPEIEGNSELRNLMQQHVQNFLTPDNPTARKFVEATYFYKLGFDVGNTMLEATQNLTTGMAELIAETGSVSDAFSLWGSAIKDITTQGVTKKWANEEQNKFMEIAAERGKKGLASWSDIVDPDSNTVFDSNAGTAANAFDVVKNAARRWSTFFSRFNDQIALLGAFKLGRSQGMDFDQATNFAFDVKDRGLFTGGKGQRPVGLWSIKTKPIPQLMSALQTYSQGWFGQMAANYTKGFGKTPEGLTETQKTGAKKAFMYSLAAQAVLAGVLGLPAVGQGIALLNQATGLDLKGWLRQNLAKLFDEDQQYGGVMTSLALRGVGAAGLPFDPSGRASISVPFLGVDAYKGFSPANLGGAVTSTMGDFMTGLLGMLGGDPTAGAKALPNVIKRPYQLMLGEGDIRDNRGALQVSLSPSERFMMASGITPTRVQTQRDISEALKKANQAEQRKREGFVDELAKKLRQGKTDEVQRDLIQHKKDHPDVDIKALVQSIASRVEAQTVPYDWRRDLNPGVELAGLSTLTPSTETLRRTVRNNTLQTLGIRPEVNPLEDYRAAMMDSLLNSNPLMSRRDAQRAVSRTRPAPTPYDWLGN